MINNEALRCLLCKKPKCSLQGCPVHTPVPEAMTLYREGKMDEAGKLLFDNNPLSAITSRVCDWKQFCYGNCILNVKQAPVKWYEIEQEISGKYLLEKHPLERTSGELRNKHITLIGAGPVGLSAAVWLYRAGALVTLVDSAPRMGGVLRYGIPTFRLERKWVDALESILIGAGIMFVPDTKVHDLKPWSKKADAVLIGTGAEKPATLHIPGEDNPMVVQALPYLKDPENFTLGKKVIVIGGGNVAMDACRTAARSGSETWVYYRKTFENMPANPLEVEEAKKDGVQFSVFQAPVEIRDGGVVFRNCENVINEEGKIITRIIDGTDHFVECDNLILAISEKPDFSILEGSGAVFNQWGWPQAGEDFKIEGLPNVYIAGDFALGPRTVVDAVATARTVVEAIKSTLK